MRIQQLMIFSGFDKNEVIYDMAWLIDHYQDDYYNRDDLAALFYECLRKLIDCAGKYGFSGNIWQCYLTNLLVNHVNEYSRGCEIHGSIVGSLNQIALHDIEIIKALFDYNFTHMVDELKIEDIDFLFQFQKRERHNCIYNQEICECICNLSKEFKTDGTAVEMKQRLTQFYKIYGVGDFGLHKGFRIQRDEDGVKIVPILNMADVHLNDLVGYELAKQRLVENTEAFVEGRKANNCLLYGDAGTGKSSSMKGLINEYYGQGLRIIEIYKHQFGDLLDVISQIKHRNYKFIIYMDDLSFEDFELEYKFLKAMIEGGLELKPDNILIYATSNRRHLVREKFSDKEDRRDNLHPGDTVQEKLSLAYRFGITIYFGSPEMKEYEQIVKVLAKRNHLEIEEKELLAQAKQWEIRNGGLSGRTAQQFIDYLLGCRNK